MKYFKWVIRSALICVFCLLSIDAYIAYAEDAVVLPLNAETVSLQECVFFALENNFEVKLSKLDFLIAETGKSSAEAVFDSILSAGVNYSDDEREQLSVSNSGNTRGNVYSSTLAKKFFTGTGVSLSFSDTRTSTDSGLFSTNPAHTAQGALEMRQPLAKNFLGCIDRGNISVAALVIQNADLGQKERIEDIISRIEKAYWQWVSSEKSLKIHRQILKWAKSLHETNRTNYDMGNIEKGDFLASQANVLIRKKDVLIAEDNYRRSEENIKLLMNMDGQRRIHPMDVPAEKEKVEISMEDCLNRAFMKRRDYQQAKREAEIKKVVLKSKNNERWPEIDLVASMDVNGIDSGFSRAAKKISGDNNRNYYLGVEINIPLENNLAESEFKKALYDKEKSILSLKQVERRIVTEVGNAFRHYLTYKINLATLIEVADLQSEKLKEEERVFGYGRSDTKRLIDYQQDYLRAQLEVVTGRFALEAAGVELNKTINSILQKYEEIL